MADGCGSEYFDTLGRNGSGARGGHAGGEGGASSPLNDKPGTLPEPLTSIMEYPQQNIDLEEFYPRLPEPETFGSWKSPSREFFEGLELPDDYYFKTPQDYYSETPQDDYFGVDRSLSDPFPHRNPSPAKLNRSLSDPSSARNPSPLKWVRNWILHLHRSPSDPLPHRNPSPSKLDPSPASPGGGQGSGAQGGGGEGGESSVTDILETRTEKGDYQLVSEKHREMFFPKLETLECLGAVDRQPWKLHHPWRKLGIESVEPEAPWEDVIQEDPGERKGPNPLKACFDRWAMEQRSKHHPNNQPKVWLLLLIAALVFIISSTCFTHFIQILGFSQTVILGFWQTVILFMHMISSTRMLMVIWKYRFWLLVETILKSNKALALKLADIVRRMIPHLAPCNALQDYVTCSAVTSTFIARSDHVHIGLLPNVRLLETIDGRFKLGIDFSNQDFKIGEGLVSVVRVSKDQYRFTCEVRGNVLEDFVAITDLESMARILIILGLWEVSPKVGVIENLTLENDGIYCHALNVKEIVEGVHKSSIYFVVFHLIKEERFFVGCGIRGTPTSKVILGLTYFLSLMAAVACFYQLRESYPKVAIVSFVILSSLPIFITIIEFLGPLLIQSCFYWLFTLFCCINAHWRLGVYIWLKKIGSLLPYCDDFEPDRLLQEDGKVEVNCLFKSVYKSRERFGVPFGVESSPDWTTFSIINIDDLDTHDDRGAPWTIISPGINNSIKFKLFKLFKGPNDRDTSNDAIIFKMEFTYSIFFVKSSRMIHVRSDYDKTQREGKMTTHLSFNGRMTFYKWSVGSFHLFVYLMLTWGKMNHGVIESYENFMFRTYNHVFNVHGLAEHIEKYGLETYYVLLADQTPQSVGSIPRQVLAAKEDVNVITSCCNKLFRPYSNASGHQSLGLVSVSVQ